MTLLLRSTAVPLLAAFFALPVHGQLYPAADCGARSSSASDFINGPAASGTVRGAPASDVTGGKGLLDHVALGMSVSSLGIGGELAVSLTRLVNLRAGAYYFSFTADRTDTNIPFTANVRVQSEQVSVDWYPFHGGFRLSPGVMFGSSNRAFGGATVPAGNSFTLNHVTYYSGVAGPIQASGAVDFRHTAPTFTVGWGNWIRHAGDGRQPSHLMFPFEAGVVFNGDPKTALNFTGVVCSSPSQQSCSNITTDAQVQANIQVERKRLQDDANWLRFYPIIAGGVIYRF